MEHLLTITPYGSEHVSGAGAAEFPLTAQTLFCDSRSPLCSPLRDLPLPLRSRSSQFFSHPLTAPLPLTIFLARSAPAPLRSFCNYVSASFKQQTEKWTDFYRASSYDSAVLAVVILYVRLSVCLSATRVFSDKTKQCTAAILIPHERAKIAANSSW